MKKKLFRRMGLMLALMLILIIPLNALSEAPAAPTASPAATAAGQTEPQDDVLRVLLKQLSSHEALNIQLCGRYAVESDAGFQFQDGSEITVAAQNGDLYLQSGGLMLNMGESFVLTRHASEGESGLYIGEAENLYVGDLHLSVSDGKVQCILYIPLEQYLYGVLPYEMNDSFPLEALKAQAVAARTYALRMRSIRTNRSYDVVDTANDQVFRGYDPLTENAIRAVDETKGIVGMYKGGYAACYFSASNGGQTELPQDIWGGEGDFGYLEIKEDPYDVENPASVDKVLGVSRDGASLDGQLKDLLKAGLTEQLSALGYSGAPGDFEILSVDAIVPHTPLHETEGCRMYTQLRFDMTVQALRLAPEATAEPTAESTAEPTAEPTAQATAEPAPAATGVATSAAESIWQPLSAPAAPVSAQPTQAAPETTAPSTAAATAEAASEPTPEPTPEITPEPTPVVETVGQTLSVDVSVYDTLKDDFNLKINGSDYELVDVETLTENDQVTGYKIHMRRFGHGIGLSQRGAQQMAQAYGMGYEEILKFYYPGMTLENANLEEHVPSELDSAAKNLGAARPRPTPQPTPAPLPALTGNEYYARVTLASKASTLNVRSQPSTSATAIAALDHGARLIVMEELADGWAHIKTAEVEGYVAMQYLTRE